MKKKDSRSLRDVTNVDRKERCKININVEVLPLNYCLYTGYLESINVPVNLKSLSSSYKICFTCFKKGSRSSLARTFMYFSTDLNFSIYSFLSIAKPNSIICSVLLLSCIQVKYFILMFNKRISQCLCNFSKC
jgi:hypothetical protein